MIRIMRFALVATAAFTLTLSAMAQEKPVEKKAVKKAAESAVEKKVETTETKKSATKKKAEAAVEEKKTETKKKTAEVAEEKKAPAAAKTAEKKAVAKAGAPYTGGIINLNTATKSQLEALPGVGEANANHIIKGRPYKSADELITRKILQERYYNEFKAHVTAK